MTKLEKIELEAQKARERIAAMQTRLKEIDGQRTEQENLQIVQQVRALKLSRAELYAFIHAGTLPGALGGTVDNTTDTTTDAADENATADPDANTGNEPEPSYSRRGRNRRHERGGVTEPDNVTEPEAETSSAETPDGENPYGTTTNFESEDVNHEE